MLKTILVCLAVATITACGATDDGFKREGKPEERKLQNSLEGKVPPALQVKKWINIGDKAPRVKDFRGKVVVIQVWATWCGPCREAVPDLKRLVALTKEKGLVLLSVHTTRGGEKAAAFVKENGISWPVAVDDADKTAKALGAVSGKPDYYLVDRKGVLRFADLEEVELGRAATMLLDEPAPAATEQQ